MGTNNLNSTIKPMSDFSISNSRRLLREHEVFNNIPKINYDFKTIDYFIDFSPLNMSIKTANKSQFACTSIFEDNPNDISLEDLGKNTSNSTALIRSVSNTE